MTDNLDEKVFSLKSGGEKFHNNGKVGDIDLLSFWRWSISDLVSNTTRGVLAEFIVAKALDVDLDIARREWLAYDLETSDGVKVEVKSAAYLQSWYQSKLSNISFGIGERKVWDPSTGQYEDISRRSADIYVFALLAHKDKKSVDPLNLDQWIFYVLPTEMINKQLGQQKGLSLSRLEELGGKPVGFVDLKQVVEERSKWK